MVIPALRSQSSHTAAAVLIWAAASVLLLSSCFTGIEGTSKVKMSREDRRLSKPSEEELLMQKVKGLPLAQWLPGKKFIVADRRLASVMKSCGSVRTFASDTLTFLSASSHPSPAGIEMEWLTLSDGTTDWEYEAHISADEAPSKLISTNLAMLIDLDYIAAADRLLSGRKVYTLTADWMKPDGTKTSGRRYFPVTITGVDAGNMQFPLKVTFSDGDDSYFLLLNSGSRATDSRPFAKLFSLSDIRPRYKSVSDSVWQLIQQGKVQIGMTKEECRLSLGSPSLSDSDHDYSKIIDIWNYGDGRTLIFEDGLLVEIR